MIYFDCYEGASGDMLVGALLDIENNRKLLISRLKGFKNLKVKIKKSIRNSISGTSVKFQLSDVKLPSDIKGIKHFINNLSFTEKLKKKIMSTYELIFNAEAEVHNCPLEKVHLHELASPETLLEIASYFILIGDEEIYCSVLPLGSGRIVTAHGKIPLPSPATAAILKDVPVVITSNKKEMVTPTAAALIKMTANFTGTDMYIKKIGYGIGSRSLLRAMKSLKIDEGAEDLTQIEVSIDDITGEDISALSEELASLIRNIEISQVIMKKGRQGYLLSLLCENSKFNSIKNKIFKKSSSIGFRYWRVSRSVLPRKIVKFRNCRVKVTELPKSIKVKPEYDDLLKLSKSAGVNISELRGKITREYLNE